MNIFPAIDLKDNKVVRLSQGDYDKVKIYGNDAKKVALDFLEKGVKNLHIVDLDGAKEGMPLNRESISSILSVKGLFTQLGGGIRDEKRIYDYLELGINRVILGTIALKNPKFVEDMVKKYSDVNAFEFCKQMQEVGVSTIIYTDISKDGMMSGCNIQAYEKLCKETKLQIIASGGVSSIEELNRLKSIGCHGTIVGKALYEGKISLEEALLI